MILPLCVPQFSFENGFADVKGSREQALRRLRICMAEKQAFQWTQRRQHLLVPYFGASLRSFVVIEHGCCNFWLPGSAYQLGRLIVIPPSGILWIYT